MKNPLLTHYFSLNKIIYFEQNFEQNYSKI